MRKTARLTFFYSGTKNVIPEYNPYIKEFIKYTSIHFDIITKKYYSK